MTWNIEDGTTPSMLDAPFPSGFNRNVAANTDIAAADVNGGSCGAGLSSKSPGTRGCPKQVSAGGVNRLGFPAVGSISAECCGLVVMNRFLPATVSCGTLLALPDPAGLAAGLVNRAHKGCAIALVDKDLVLQVITVNVCGVQPELRQGGNAGLTVGRLSQSWDVGGLVGGEELGGRGRAISVGSARIERIDLPAVGGVVVEGALVSVCSSGTRSIGRRCLAILPRPAGLGRAGWLGKGAGTNRCAAVTLVEVQPVANIITISIGGAKGKGGRDTQANSSRRRR